MENIQFLQQFVSTDPRHRYDSIQHIYRSERRLEATDGHCLAWVDQPLLDHPPYFIDGYNATNYPDISVIMLKPNELIYNFEIKITADTIKALKSIEKLCTSLKQTLSLQWKEPSLTLQCNSYDMALSYKLIHEVAASREPRIVGFYSPKPLITALTTMPTTKYDTVIVLEATDNQDMPIHLYQNDRHFMLMPTKPL